MSSSGSILLGITGGIACGKTEVGRILSAEGFKVLDTDFLAHELMQKGRPVYEEVAGAFGKAILAEDEEIDRRKLGSLVFDNPAALEKLNRIVHPAVMDTAGRWVNGCREAREDAAVLVPLLFESGWTAGWDAVICVTAPEEQVFKRLKTRGLSRERARKRIEAQMPIQEKAARADFVMDNSGTPDALRNRMIDLVEKIKCEKRTRNE